MLGSHNYFFNQSKDILLTKKKDVRYLLFIKGYDWCEIDIYLKAFDYFCKNATQFDGATIVKDLVDLPGLDLDAMLHDYHYVACSSATNFYTKWHADWIYAKGQERKGKAQYSSFTRFTGLTIVGLWFVPYARLKRGVITFAQEKELFEDYKILITKHYEKI